MRATPEALSLVGAKQRGKERVSIMPMMGVVRTKPKRAVMKRDMELARTIMLRLEAVPENSHLANPPEDLDLPDLSLPETTSDSIGGAGHQGCALE